jgi:hypothetical protein
LAAGVVFLSWSAFEIYVTAQKQLLDLSTTRAQNCEARMAAIANTGVFSGHGDIGKDYNPTAAQRQWDADCSDYLPDQYNKQEAAAAPAKGSGELSFWDRLERTHNVRLKDYTSMGFMFVVIAGGILLSGISRAWIRFLWGGGIALALVGFLFPWSLTVFMGGLVLIIAAALYGAKRFLRKEAKP